MGVDLVLDLGDGTSLASSGFGEAGVFLRLRNDRVVEYVARPPKGRRAAVMGRQSDEPIEELPVIGRSLVEILTRALELGALPPPIRVGWDPEPPI